MKIAILKKKKKNIHGVHTYLKKLIQQKIEECIEEQKEGLQEEEKE